MSFNSTEWVFSVLSFQVCSVDNWKVTPHKHFVSTSFSFVITYSNTIGSFRIDLHRVSPKYKSRAAN